MKPYSLSELHGIKKNIALDCLLTKRTMTKIVHQLIKLESESWSETLLNVQEQNQHLNHRITALEAELSEWKKAVEGLTPSGSEFVNDPKACADHIRERTRYPKMIVDLRRKVVALEAERDVIKSLVCKACNGVGSVGRMTVDGWEDDDCPYCVGQIKDQARLAAARECLGIIGNGGWYNEDLENAIRQHFGMDDHFADAGKPIEGGEPCA